MRRRTVLAGVGSLAALGTVPGSTVARSQADEFGPAGRVDVTGTMDTAVSDDGETVYVAVTDGLAVVDVSDLASPTVLAERRDLQADHEQGPLTGIWDVEVSGSNVLVAGPAGAGRTELRGAALFDVSTPDAPELVSFHETDHAVHNVALDGTTAYLTGSGDTDEPVVVVEMDDGGEASALTEWSPVDADDRLANVDRNLRNCHDLMLDGDRLYASYWETGTWVVDVADPASPSPVARIGGLPIEDLTSVHGNDRRRAMFNPPGNAHNADINEAGVLAVSHEAFGDGVEGMGGVSLWDVSDLSSGLVEDGPGVPTLETSRRGPVLAPSAPNPGEGLTLTTAHNCTFRGDRLYTSWYTDGVRVYDLSDPAAPGLVAGYAAPTEASFFDAVPVTGGFAAPSMGVAGTDGGSSSPARLYTFASPPDDAATEPAATRTPIASQLASTTTSESAADSGSASGSDSESTTSPGTGSSMSSTETPTSSDAESPPTTTDADEGSSGFGPGFGPLATLAGGALATWRLLGGDESEE